MEPTKGQDARSEEQERERIIELTTLNDSSGIPEDITEGQTTEMNQTELRRSDNPKGKATKRAKKMSSMALKPRIGMAAQVQMLKAENQKLRVQLYQKNQETENDQKNI